MDKYFFRCAGIRALKTFCEAIVSQVTIGQAFGDVNWAKVLSVAFLAAVLAFLSCFAGLPEVEANKRIEP